MHIIHILYHPCSVSLRGHTVPASNSRCSRRVERVKESPHYVASGEVRVATFVKKYDLMCSYFLIVGYN